MSAANREPTRAANREPTRLRILIIIGHPDPAGGHFDHALADAYAAGAREAGHAVERLDIARINIPVLRSKRAFEEDAPPPDIAAAQEKISNCDILVMIFPLWLGGMPGLLKLFLEQVLRPGFAFDYTDDSLPVKRLKGRRARLILTMGMPALAYRLFYGAHSLRSLKRNILYFVGIKPVRTTLIGSIEAIDDQARTRWLEKIRLLGAKAR
jgi:putative NADPH-quinone reductase